MRCRFFILVVFATAVVQYSLAGRTTTSNRIQTEAMADYSTADAFKKIAHLEYQKVVDIIFNILTDLANVACGNQDPPQGNSSEPNIFKIELSSPLITQYDVTFLASQINNPKIYITSPNTQAAAITQIHNIAASLSKGIDLAQCTNSSGGLTEIEALENKTFTGFTGVNAIIYDTFPDIGNNPSKSESVIARARQQSNAQLRIAVRNIYDVIKAGCENVFFVIESARNQAAIAFEAVVEITFGLIYKFLFAFFVIQNGIVPASSVIQTITMAATSDYDKTLNNIPTVTQDGSTNVIPQNEDKTMAVSAAIDDAEKNARRGISTLISLTFATINITSANIADGNQCGFEGDDSITVIAARKEFVVSMVAIDSYFNTTVLVEPRATSAVNSIRNETFCFVTKLLEGIKTAIELTEKKDSTQISAIIESVEKASISAAIIVTENIFVPIINASKYQPQTEPVVIRLREQTLDLIEKAYQSIFIAIKILLAQAFPEYRLEGGNCFASIGAAETVTISAYMEVVTNIFIAIRILFTASPNNQIETIEDFCPCAAAY